MTILFGCAEKETLTDGNNVNKTISFTTTVDTRTAGICNDNEMELFYSIYDSSTGEKVNTAKESRSFSYGIIPVNDIYTGKIEVALQEKKSYDIIFWLQDKEETAYDINDLRYIKIDYSNIDRKEAFVGILEKFLPETEDSIQVILKNPFAILNIYTEKEDIEDAARAGLDINGCKYSFLVDELADVYSPLTSSVSFSDSKRQEIEIVSRNSKDIPSLTEEKEYCLLGRALMLVGDRELTNIKTILTGENISPIKTVFNNIPLRKSFNTNIMGRFLTSEVAFNVTIEPSFNGEHTDNY